jgi:hypothetical protein
LLFFFSERELFFCFSSVSLNFVTFLFVSHLVKYFSFRFVPFLKKYRSVPFRFLTPDLNNFYSAIIAYYSFSHYRYPRKYIHCSWWYRATMKNKIDHIATSKEEFTCSWTGTSQHILLSPYLINCTNVVGFNS